jgi:uncharacterized membrane protein YgaE (UPF0421/DUF939 family)
MREAIRSVGQRVRFEAIFAVQSGVAAGLAWFLAVDVLHRVRPFFAPIAAVIVLSAGVGLRWVRALELACGVGVGIALGDFVVRLIGVGPVQIAVLVALAIIAIAVFGRGGVAVGQAGASAVLVATLAPPAGGIFYERFFDALVGGFTALIVMILLPFNPLTRVRRAAGQVLTVLADALARGARSIDLADPALADATLTMLREHDPDRDVLRDAVTIGRETATVAPLRWGTRAAVGRYGKAAAHVDRATRSVRVIESRIATLLRDREPTPDALGRSLAVLAEGVRSLRHDLADGRDPAHARTITLDAVRVASLASAQGLGRSGLVVVDQVASAAANLLSAAGTNEHDANAQVRHAVAGRDPDGGTESARGVGHAG